jgi:hypothetical protein
VPAPSLPNGSAADEKVLPQDAATDLVPDVAEKLQTPSQTSLSATQLGTSNADIRGLFLCAKISQNLKNAHFE